jgi:hypothetical protein
MIGDVSAAVVLKQLDAKLFQAVARDENILLVAVTPQREDMRMLQQQQLVADFSRLPLRFKSGLQF